jgi:hypothetical protein
MSGKMLIITEGDSEDMTLRDFIKKWSDYSRINNDVDVRYIVFDPYSGDDKAIQSLASFRNKIFKNGYASARYCKIILLLDYEQREMNIMEGLKDKLCSLLSQVFPETECKVVFKMRTFENWLISDPDIILQMNRFSRLSEAHKRAISTNSGADRQDGLNILKQASHGNYHKTSDSVDIMNRIRAIELEKNSRSFRKLLAELGAARYRAGSCTYVSL